MKIEARKAIASHNKEQMKIELVASIIFHENGRNLNLEFSWHRSLSTMEKARRARKREKKVTTNTESKFAK